MTRIFVGNLPYQSTEDDVQSAFEKFGRVASVQLPCDHGTGRPRGIAFVAMPRLEDADEAIARLNGSMLQGRRLVVNVAEDRYSGRDRQPAPQSREASRFHLV